MKIAHINMFYLPTYGGVERVIQELTESQVKQGHEVHVFCCDSDKYSRISKKEEIINGVVVHRYPYWFRLSLSTFIWPSLLWKLPKYNFDILHSHVSGHLYVLITGIISKFKSSRHIHTTHCPWTDAFRPNILKPFIFINDLFLNKLSFKLIDKVVSITPWELETLKKYTDKKKIITIPNGVDPILFKEISPNKFKQKYSIKGKVILFFGRLNPTKGPEVLAKAGKDLVKERKDLNFVFIGPDEGKAQEVNEIIKDQERMFYFGPIKGKENIAEMYQAADVFVMPSYREGLPLCCHPETLIETETGLKEINKVQINEKVLTYKGNFCKVLKIMKRKINEEIISIKPYGINQEIKLTKEHSILAIKRPKKQYNKSLGQSITESGPEWIGSEKLKEGDCVVFPIPKISSNLECFDLKKFDSSLQYSSRQVWYKMGFSGKNQKNSYSDLMIRTGESKRVIEDAVNFFKKGALPKRSKRVFKILKFLEEINFELTQVNKYPRFIKIDEELAYVCGWYIAEGSIGGGFIRFAMNKNEINYAREIDKIISKKFGVKGNICFENNNRLILVFSGKILEKLFTKLCGHGCRNKRIPRELFDIKLLPSLIKGLFLGDGHQNKIGWTLHTTSRQLANDTILALLTLKKKFNFHKPKRDIFVVNYQPNNPNISHSNKSWFVKNNLCFLIRKIKRERYKGEVYNLEIEKDNSYTTSAFCVHNCLFEAMASGLPVIASPVNGIPFEMKDNENGYFVNYGDIDSLKEKILKVIDNPSISKKFSKNNKEKSKNYTWDLINKRYLEVYNA